MCLAFSSLQMAPLEMSFIHFFFGYVCSGLGFSNYSLLIYLFIVCQPSNVYKLNKFEIDWTNQAKSANISLHERDVTMSNLWVCLKLWWRNFCVILSISLQGTASLVYWFSVTSPFSRSSLVRIFSSTPSTGRTAFQPRRTFSWPIFRVVLQWTLLTI